jgi:hypothetical protein
MDRLEIIREKERKRYAVLLKLWEATGGKELSRVNFDDIAKQAGLNKEETSEVYVYFMNEGFFGARDMGGRVTLSHKAIIEVEQSIKNPTASTEHFAATVIQHFNAPVGSVQTGQQSTAYVNQNFGASTSEVLNLIRELRQSVISLPPDQQGEALEVIDALEEEAQLPTPRKGRIRAFLAQIGSVAKDVGVNVAATAIAKYYNLDQ